MKTAVVTDSTAYIPKDLRDRYNIYMIPLNVIFGETSYREEIDMSWKDYYKEVKAHENLPTTSQPAYGELISLYEKLGETYDAVISIHLSSGISGTFNSAVSARGMLEGIKVYPFDSEISCTAQGFYAIEAAEMAEKGAAPEEIIRHLDHMKISMRAYFMVDDLSHLQRGGRLSGAQAFVGSLLKVKPILHFENKLIVPYEKIRTRKKAMNRLFELFGEDAEKGKPLRAVVIHANREEEADQIIEELSQQYAHVEFYKSYFGPVIGTHLGEGAMGIAWYTV
ncbi:fatty acid-binding protein DegV [Bacillus paralicheniformis]|uniref:DegV family protein n=1 Tax=Bacillus TaxID=1386 RepID=UPI0003A1986D|nr:DegV family protein [Bacillus paralicheniformis]MSN98822.1 DegV family EDD domain-containing protein [Bacillus paralicheniformis]MSO02830.1 DegV family EDD domain-containing protein [Bacillus paralicheniformis]MSO06823.1 DegV family EDD domain-containing protein [Bacillus paralicheniformis]MSO10817.1 DegV family EDD domain-containing protein [Bacillus paralicheniformis]NJE36099.1 DegV family protein [Bacillus paralicheniformis]